jgi:Rnl2 family RNA ligase
MFYKYPSIVTLDRRPEILTVKNVVAVEKLHGSNLRLYLPSGITSINDIQYGSRNEEFGTGENGSFYGGRPIQWFKDRPELLQKMFEVFTHYRFSDVIVYGEICGTGIQKGVTYAAPGEIIFRAFDIRVGGNFLTYDLFVEVCSRIGLPRCKEIWRGAPSLENFDKLLGTHSQEGVDNGVDCDNNIAEGVVIRSNPLLRNTFGEYLIIKHKSEKFKENASAPRTPTDQSNTSEADNFAATFVVPGRMINTVGRLRDSGTDIKDDMSDMRYLVPAIIADITKECKPEWDEALAKGATEGQLRKSITKQANIVYRRMLMESVG